jgi:hypothetical protein
VKEPAEGVPYHDDGCRLPELALHDVVDPAHVPVLSPVHPGRWVFALVRVGDQPGDACQRAVGEVCCELGVRDVRARLI